MPARSCAASSRMPARCPPCMHAVVVPFGCLAAGDWQLLAVQSPEHAESALALKASVSASRKVLHCALLVHPCCCTMRSSGIRALTVGCKVLRFWNPIDNFRDIYKQIFVATVAQPPSRCRNLQRHEIGAVTGLPNYAALLCRRCIWHWYDVRDGPLLVRAQGRDYTADACMLTRLCTDRNEKETTRHY